MMQRYFVNKEQINENTISIVGDDVHHITRVLRMTEGDEILCSCQDTKKTAHCKIDEISNEQIIAHVVKWVEANSELPVRVTIASGLPKGDKLEWIIQKGTELGAESFIPFNAARSIVKWDEKKGGKKVERWSKIAKEAAEQSHRVTIPTIHAPFSFKQLCEVSTQYDKKIVAYEEAAKRGEKSAFARVLKEMKANESVLIVFGPEGGLSEKEVDTLLDIGFVSCSFGPRILRTETAPLYGLAAISYHFELM